MAEPYSPYPSTDSTSATLQALFGPQPTAPASTTYVATPTFGQLLTSIQDMDRLVDPPLWSNNNQRTRALELARVLRDFGGYNQFHWQLTSGISNLPLRQRIAQKFPDYPKFYSKKGLFSSIIIPGTDVKFDVPHFNAALSRYLDCYSDDCALPTEWASWAGDMFTYAAHLDSIQRNNSLSYTTIRDSALNHIGGIHPQYSKFFGTGDFYADIDARNIASLISNRGLSFYEAMNRYYKQGDFDRFGTFIHSYGGWKKFAEKVNKHYFFPLTLKINPYILKISKQAFINKVLREFLHEMEMD